MYFVLCFGSSPHKSSQGPHKVLTTLYFQDFSFPLFLRANKPLKNQITKQNTKCEDCEDCEDFFWFL